MKNSVFTIMALLFSLALNAQITLEHTYSYSGTLTEIDSSEFKYFIMDVPMKQCRIYNEDHTLYKTIDLAVPEGYYLNDVKYVSRKTFNTDEQIELLYIYAKTTLLNSEYVYTYGLRVVNEIGNTLLNLQDGGFAEIKEFDGAPKLFAYQYIYYENYYLVNTKVYAIGGSDTKSVQIPSDPSLRIYPNPAGDLVRIEMSPGDLSAGGQVMICDLSGKILREQSYGPGLTSIQISTGNLDPGTYIVNVKSANGKRAAGKIAKN